MEFFKIGKRGLHIYYYCLYTNLPQIQFDRKLQSFNDISTLLKQLCGSGRQAFEGTLNFKEDSKILTQTYPHGEGKYSNKHKPLFIAYMHLTVADMYHTLLD